MLKLKRAQSSKPVEVVFESLLTQSVVAHKHVCNYGIIFLEGSQEAAW